MKSLKGKVAVVTGGASGIGRAMAERFAEEGMKIVLGDVETEALEKTAAELRADGAEVLAVVADVSREADVEGLARTAIDAHGRVHVVCNNAGVGYGGRCWEIGESDWRWVMGVNLWGVIYGIRHFVPHMLSHGEESHVVNVASMAGLTTGAGMAPYFVSKHGVVALSECLYKELEMENSAIGVSVLCPAWVKTNIADSDRNRPEGPVAEEDRDPASAMFDTMVRQALETGLSPKQVAQMVLDAVLAQRFYVLPHPHWKPLIQTRMEDILEDRPPSTVLPPEFTGEGT